MSSPARRWLSGALLVGGASAILILEYRHPLRRQTQPKLSRDARNLAMAGLSGAVLAVLQAPVTDRLTTMVDKRRWGILKRFDLPPWLEVPLAVAALDYTLYLWHVWTHLGPLWRFHKVHHADLDMDASTALRFHVGEMIASIPYRAAQILLIGSGPRAFAVWQAFLMACITFHHSNLRLPARIERALGLILVTPRNHGIHHSIEPAQTDANWSSGLTLWDRLHGTLRLDDPQAEIIIGVADTRDPSALRLAGLLAMPFRSGRPAT